MEPWRLILEQWRLKRELRRQTLERLRVVGQWLLILMTLLRSRIRIRIKGKGIRIGIKVKSQIRNFLVQISYFPSIFGKSKTTK
jgi:hypothetical protein